MSYRRRALAALALSTAASAAAPPPRPDAGPFVNALWLVQRRGPVGPSDDVSVKGRLSRALGKDGSINAENSRTLMDAKDFDALAGPDGSLDAGEARRAVEADAPPSRSALRPALRERLDALTTGFDLIADRHRGPARALGDWVARNHKPGVPLRVIAVCTGNTRRSVLSAMMGNAAADYYGLPEVRFLSGGTAPEAVNPRTVAALREAGFVVEPTGDEAPRGKPETPNPVYRISWGASPDDPNSALEFSKLYDDPANPAEGFAALMVCGEADASCPFVKGAAARVSMPYLDPKAFDGGPYETAKYAERRDDIGRVLLSALLHARRAIDGVATP